MNGEKYKNSENIANAFNLYFNTIMFKRLDITEITSRERLNKNKFYHYLSLLPIGPIYDFKQELVTGKEIKDIIKSLKSKNSYDCDGISTKIPKLSMSLIVLPLIYICNRSLSTGIFPSRLKYSQIHPIYKKGERSEISNYRPISVLTSFSKIFERVIFKRVYSHVCYNNILVNEQYGFRKTSSTEIASFNLISNILQALSDKKSWLVVFFVI
jgi:hypothetical protein